jgi:GT2 family glycosyltransferase
VSKGGAFRGSWPSSSTGTTQEIHRPACVLNNDVTVAPDFVAPLLDALQESNGAGAVTPLITSIAQPERVWALGGAVDYRADIAPVKTLDQEMAELSAIHEQIQGSRDRE